MEMLTSMNANTLTTQGPENVRRGGRKRKSRSSTKSLKNKSLKKKRKSYKKSAKSYKKKKNSKSRKIKRSKRRTLHTGAGGVSEVDANMAGGTRTGDACRAIVAAGSRTVRAVREAVGALTGAPTETERNTDENIRTDASNRSSSPAPSRRRSSRLRSSRLRSSSPARPAPVEDYLRVRDYNNERLNARYRDWREEWKSRRDDPWRVASQQRNEWIWSSDPIIDAIRASIAGLPARQASIARRA